MLLYLKLYDLGDVPLTIHQSPPDFKNTLTGERMQSFSLTAAFLVEFDFIKHAGVIKDV